MPVCGSRSVSPFVQLSCPACCSCAGRNPDTSSPPRTRTRRSCAGRNPDTSSPTRTFRRSRGGGNLSLRHQQHSPARTPPIVVPAEAGIQRDAERGSPTTNLAAPPTPPHPVRAIRQPPPSLATVAGTFKPPSASLQKDSNELVYLSQQQQDGSCPEQV